MQPSGIQVSALGCWDIAGILEGRVTEWIYSPRIFRG
jgi:hypothetical protein